MCVRRSPTFVGLLLLTGLANSVTGSVAEAQPTLDELLKEYRKFGLPLPPRKAKLVRFEVGGGDILNGEIQPLRYGLAFLLKAGDGKEKALLFRGTQAWRPSWDTHPQEVAADPAGIKDVNLGWNDELAWAIQCHERGWHKLADYMLEQERKKEKIPLRQQLIEMAWDYWESQLTRPKIDRAPVAKRLREVIRQDKKQDTEYHRALLKSLDLALVPSKNKPGSIEAFIDDLVDYNADTGTLGIFEPEDRYWRIAKLGFEAVPALIEHLDDDRLTRAMMQGFNNFRSWHLRVGDVVGDLLQGLAGEEVGRDWLDRQLGKGVAKKKAKSWWEKARKVGEETYLLDHVLVNATDSQMAHVSAHLLNVILAKYPKRIPSLYRKVLDKRPEVDSEMLADTLVLCKIPAKEQFALILHAARHKDNKHRLPALYAIKNLDKKQFEARLLATIGSFPKDVGGPYWLCPEASIAGLAVECDDPRIWPILEKVAKRSAVGLRMEILHHLDNRAGDRRRRERLHLLSAFLDDTAVRTLRGSESKFDGPCAGFIYPTLEVRDFAALELAEILRIKIEEKLRRTPKEWADVRKRVHEALKRE